MGRTTERAREAVVWPQVAPYRLRGGAMARPVRREPRGQMGELAKRCWRAIGKED